MKRSYLNQINKIRNIKLPSRNILLPILYMLLLGSFLGLIATGISNCSSVKITKLKEKQWKAASRSITCESLINYYQRVDKPDSVKYFSTIKEYYDSIYSSLNDQLDLLELEKIKKDLEKSKSK